MADLNTDTTLSSPNIGAVVENLSNKKLFVILGCLAALQTVFFLLGGVVAPQPSSYMTFEMTLCVDTYKDNVDHWFYIHPKDQKGCKRKIEQSEIEDSTHIISYDRDARDLVFVAQMPHIRENKVLRYSPWFQSLLGMLVIQTQYMPQPQYSQWRMMPDPVLRLEVRMGYKNSESEEWHELTSATINRKLRCIEPQPAYKGAHYDCEPMELFELGSVDYPFYLINIRVPHKVANTNVSSSDDQNAGIGRLTGFHLVGIHQNGGFTQVWLSMKTVLFPVILVSLIWYWRRVRMLTRPPLLLEKSLVALGVAMLFIDLPIEWLSLMTKTPFMLLLSDIRQGIFYAMLLSFWLIFVGEHLLDDGRKNHLGYYWKHLTAVFFGCACMFIFDMCERGVHLTNPFYSIWSTTLGTNLAYGFVILAAISAILYFFFIFYWICRVMFTVKAKRATLLNLRPSRRLRFEAIVYRFKFLMLFTVVCAALTVSAFIMTKIGEDQMHWGDWDESPMIQYSSAFLTGVYGMWNIYTMLLLFMYAPSHKRYGEANHMTTSSMDDEDDENGDYNGRMVTESSALTTLVKPAVD